MYKIGIFTKHGEKNDIFDHYHNSNCKIYKIIHEMQKIIDFDYKINNYGEKYDFAICDRIKPKAKVDSNYILSYSEGRPASGWSTHGCTTSIGVDISKKNNFYLLNYCQGKMIDKNGLSKKRNKAVFLGRVTGEIENKLLFLSKHINIDIYPIKYWDRGTILRFAPHNPLGYKNIKYLQNKVNSLGAKNILIKTPKSHNFLYKTLNNNGYAVGFVPSIYGFGSNKIQVESSSKFFEYIGCGIPVLVEHSVPEAYFVKNNSFLGEIYYSKKDLVKKVNIMRSKKYNYIKILNYANKNHFPDSRAKTLYSKFILNGKNNG